VAAAFLGAAGAAFFAGILNFGDHDVEGVDGRVVVGANQAIECSDPGG